MYFPETIDINNFHTPIFSYGHRGVVQHQINLDTNGRLFGGTISSAVIQNVQEV